MLQHCALIILTREWSLIGADNCSPVSAHLFDLPVFTPQVLAPCARRININDKIFSLYLDHLIPGITQLGDDNNYGSAALSDVLTLQVQAASLCALSCFPWFLPGDIIA